MEKSCVPIVISGKGIEEIDLKENTANRVMTNQSETDQLSPKLVKMVLSTNNGEEY